MISSISNRSHVLQVWDRDVAAAKNMMRCTIAVVTEQLRPESMRRQQTLPEDPVQAALADAVDDAEAE